MNSQINSSIFACYDYDARKLTLSERYGIAIVATVFSLLAIISNIAALSTHYKKFGFEQYAIFL